MLKLVGIIGSNADISYNRMLLEYIEKTFYRQFDLELLEIKDVPLFNQSEDQTNSRAVQKLKRKIENADGVIIATPEHNHTIPAALKSTLEWLSFKIHPLENKPVMIIGASYFDQGSSRAQLHLRQILDAPGVNALVMPGNEFLLGKVKSAFDEEGNLKDSGTKAFLGTTLNKFLRYIDVTKALDEKQEEKPLPEDLFAQGKIETTIDYDMYADDWLEQVEKIVDPATEDDYVKLNRGLLTVDQLNGFLSSMPMELTFVDSNNQFLYYNYNQEASEMLAPRVPGQVGNPLGKCHPEKAYKNVEWVIQQLRTGKQDVIRVHVPKHEPEKYVVHNYQAVKDSEGNYLGINEYILDFLPIVNWYLKQTGQQLVKTGSTLPPVGPTEKVDATSSASVKDTATEVPEQVDATSSASVKDEAPTPAPVVKEEVDATSSASIKD